ncbi:hypothetical protein K227x_08570 [Rubripirellula lacrimiformis]|uniref:AsmA-like C-terminal domain-containing protein n=1 Tax=Rubripirellula lacrimiformis TaxID=1930273 RepID=A0A517N5R1_9BACT|nr:hypothetical protein [Rubripirellula lacrimiformis]QDT02480.1 hypothetical protein K227x_08570 [Rubripirellula lacrimiformis]
MHERTQRGIARLMFVLCCAVPTSITLAVVVMMATPWYAGRVRRSAEAELSRATGLVVQIGRFTRTSPSTIRIDELRILEPETQAEVAYVRQLDWVDRDDEVSILLRQPKLQSATLPSAWRLIHDRFLCRPEQTGRPIRFAANDLTIADGPSSGMTLTDVDAWIEPEPDAVQAVILCMLATSGSDASRDGTPIDITIRRDRSGQTPTTEWTIDTHDNALPCTTLAKYLDGPMGRLGAAATFSGSMRWHLEADRWWIDLGTSHIDGLSLDRISEKQPHRFSGTGRLDFERCRIEPRRSVDIAGTFTASDGQIGRSLLASAHMNLGFDVRVPPGTEDLQYDRIAMRFSLLDTELRINGICHTEQGYTSFPEGIAMHAGGFPLVRTDGLPLRSIALMTALAPSHSEMVPLSAQNAWLTDILIPPSRPMPHEPAAMRAKIRTAREYSGGPVTEQPL